MERLSNVHPARQGSPGESVSYCMCVCMGGWATLRPFVVGHRLSPGLCALHESNYQAPVVDDCMPAAMPRLRKASTVLDTRTRKTALE